MSDPYLWVKWLHILSATVLFGTGLGTAFHMYATHRRGDVAAIASATRNTVLADWLFIATSGMAQPLTGAVLIDLGGHDFGESWLIATYVLYVVVALCWFGAVRMQYLMRGFAARAMAEGAPLPAGYHRAVRRWFALGWPAFVGLIVVFALMVMKPTLW